jgi:hypothetical protein
MWLADRQTGHSQRRQNDTAFPHRYDSAEVQTGSNRGRGGEGVHLADV